MSAIRKEILDTLFVLYFPFSVRNVGTYIGYVNIKNAIQNQPLTITGNTHQRNAWVR